MPEKHYIECKFNIDRFPTAPYGVESCYSYIFIQGLFSQEPLYRDIKI